MKWVKQAVGYWCGDIISNRCMGQGVCIAVLDTGITLHPDFDRRIIGFRDFVNYKESVYDDGRHGTHVAGILAGSGKLSDGVYAGMAPKAEILMGKVLDNKGNGSVNTVVEGIDWLLNVHKKLGVRIVNISVGTQPGVEKAQEKRLTDAVEKLWDAGLVVVVSAGNYGPGVGTVAVPGTSRKVITVGALAERETAVGSINAGREWNYSGNGPTEECVVKPDVLVPGTNILSCNGDYTNRWQKPYIMKSGTSMATPVVSGAIACLLSKYPDMDNVEVKLKLRSSCVRTSYARQGWGLLNVGSLLSP
ncbi:serine protease AprX [Muricomes intestini]|jgi:serine protease AprX|uniref:Serine protease AprX n=2 Tax=Muricomes intestini TaxID=1796634 RepID=A0A4R3K195_9FIRM|nr:S8 family peptidase [Muricomes intestini]TCS74257.1 serine protease AprX [Muricomes intestini]HAX51630.1 peptidase S8 [Lachnospiraceae bacterium]